MIRYVGHTMSVLPEQTRPGPERIKIENDYRLYGEVRVTYHITSDKYTHYIYL